MRIFIFALFVASCYAGPLDLVHKLPPAVVTEKVVLPQKTVTVQRDIPVKALPRLVTITRPVPSVPKIVTIDKKVTVTSTPKIVTIHKHVPVKTQVVVPRPIPTPPRIITIERPVPVPQTVIVDKPYLVPTPVIIPRPVAVIVDKKSAIAKRGPINLQPIIAAGPLSKPLPTPLAHPQALVTGRTATGAITIGNLGGPILVGGKVLSAPLLAPGKVLHHNLGGIKLGGLVPLKSNLVINPLINKGKLDLPLHNTLPISGKLHSPLLVDANLGILGAPLAPNQQLLLDSGLKL